MKRMRHCCAEKVRRHGVLFLLPLLKLLHRPGNHTQLKHSLRMLNLLLRKLVKK